MLTQVQHIQQTHQLQRISSVTVLRNLNQDWNYIYKYIEIYVSLLYKWLLTIWRWNLSYLQKELSFSLFGGLSSSEVTLDVSKIWVESFIEVDLEYISYFGWKPRCRTKSKTYCYNNCNCKILNKRIQNE